MSEIAKKQVTFHFVKYFNFKTFPSLFAGIMFSRIPLKLEKLNSDDTLNSMLEAWNFIKNLLFIFEF